MWGIRSRFLFVYGLGLLSVFATSCDKHTRVPESEWRTLRSYEGKQWEVATSEAIYRVQRFAVTDSTLVLHDVSAIERYDTGSYPPGFKPSSEEYDLPITIPLGEVVSVELVETSGRRTTLLVLGIVAATTLVIVASLSRATISFGR